MLRKVRKHTFGTVNQAKIQISLHIHTVWSESSLAAFWKAKDAKFQADMKISDQTARKVQADLSLRWTPIPEGTFFHVVAHIIFNMRKGPFVIICQQQRPSSACTSRLHLSLNIYNSHWFCKQENKGPDQTAQMCSLIRSFVACVWHNGLFIALQDIFGFIQGHTIGYVEQLWETHFSKTQAVPI